MEKITALLTKKDDFEIRVISKQNLQYVFGHQDFNARTKIQNFYNESSSKTVEFSIDTLMGDTKAVATQTSSMRIRLSHH